MAETKIFYYHFKKINFWLFFNILITYILVYCAIKYTYCCRWSEYYILTGLAVISWGLWGFKYLLKQKLAVITDESIKIDHCQPLLWKNVLGAEERIVRCCLKKLKVIIFITREDMEYKYNFLQQHNGDFTPFSLPLYPVVTDEDIQQMKKLVASKVKYTSLPKKK